MRAVNLLPREPKRSRKPTAVLQLAIVSPFVVAALIAAGYLLESAKVSDNKATLQDAQAQLAALPRPTPQPQVAANAQLAVQRDQRIAALGTVLQGQIAWDRLLRQISEVVPGDVWLTALSAQSPPQPTATAPAAPTTTPTTTTTTTTTTTAPPPAAAPTTPTTGPLTIAGYTYSQPGVARLLSRLALIPELTDVTLVSSSQTLVAGQEVYSFSIQAGVQPQVTG